MDSRGNPGSRDSLFRSAFASVKRCDPSIFRPFGSTHEDNDINDQFDRLSLSDSQVPENVEEASKRAEAGSSNREVTTWENGTPFLIDLNISAETQDAAAGVEVGIPEPQVTTLANGTSFIDLTISDSDEDRSPADLTISQGDEAIHEAATDPWEEEAHANVDCETHAAFEGETELNGREIVVHESHEAINFSLPDLNETFSEDAAETSTDIPDGIETSSEDVAAAYEAERRTGKVVASEAPSAMDIDSSDGDETIDEEAAAREAAEKKRKDKAIAYASVSGQLVGCSNDSDSIPLVDGVDEGDVVPDVVTGNELVVYEGRDTRSESEAPRVSGNKSQKQRAEEPKILDGKKKRKAQKRKTPDVVRDNGPTEALPPRRNPRRRTHQDPDDNLLLLANTSLGQNAITAPAVASTSRSEPKGPKTKSLHAIIASEKAKGHVPSCPIEEPEENAEDAYDAVPVGPVEEPNNAVSLIPVEEPNNVGPDEESDDVALASLIKRKVGRANKNKKQKVDKREVPRFSEGGQNSNYVPKGYLKVYRKKGAETVSSNEDRMGVANCEVSDPRDQVGGPSISGLGSGVDQTINDANMNEADTDPLGDDGVDVANHEDAGQHDQEGGSEPLEIGWPATSRLGSEMGRAVEGTSWGVETDPLGDDGVDIGSCDQEGGPATSGLGSEGGRAGEGTGRGAQTVVARPWYCDIMVVFSQNPADFGAKSHDNFKC